jgi:hypothetical protein
MTMALAAVAIEAAMGLLEPWPIKIVLDYLLQSRRLPGWMIVVVGWLGDGKLAILNFAVVAVAAIAVVGAVSSYLENYLTTNAGQWVMHELRRTLTKSSSCLTSRCSMRACGSTGLWATTTAPRNDFTNPST